jgi:hypothetical protein
VNVNPESNSQPEMASPKRTVRWPLLLLFIAIVIGGVYAMAFVAASLLAEPAYKSIDDIDPAAIQSMGVLVLNRPDGGPDITAGGKELWPVPKEAFANVLAPLCGATPLTGGRPIYLGQIQMVFNDGRKLTVMMHRIGDEKIKLSIERYEYEVAPIDKFLKPLIEVEADARKEH